MFRYNASKRGENYSKFVDESRKDISGLIQVWVISAAEKSSGQPLLIVESFRDRMGQRRLADSGQAVDPVGVTCILLHRAVGRPDNDVIQEEFAGAFHTAELPAIAGLDVFEPPEQKLLLCMRPMRMDYRGIETIYTYRSP